MKPGDDNDFVADLLDPGPLSVLEVSLGRYRALPPGLAEVLRPDILRRSG